MSKSEKTKKKGGNWSTYVLLAILLAGLVLVGYPTVSDWWNSFHQSRAVAAYVEQVDSMDGREEEALLQAAREYNERLAEVGTHFVFDEAEQEEYLSLLDITGTGIMGYVNVPSIDVNLPIYHGTGDAVLQIATGHLEGTSLPVGGESTHAAISGHRGLPSARLFTDLDQLQPGDIFTVTVLHQTITYMVDQIRIVLPEDVSDLAIVPGEDHFTLVTCTPYGVNSHRMLVRGTRIENIKEAPFVTPDATRISTYVVIPALAVPLLFALLAGLLFYYNVRRPRKNKKELLEEYQEIRHSGLQDEDKDKD